MTKEGFKEILLSSMSSFRFLAAEDGYWLGVDDNGIERDIAIDDMSNSYKKNCINYLYKQRENIERGFFLQGAHYDKSDYEELVKFGCEAMEEKISQLSK